MKRIVIFALLFCLFLTGCQKDMPEYLSYESPEISLDGSTVSQEILNTWNDFYWDTQMGQAAQINLAVFGCSEGSIQFNGSTYTLSDNTGPRTYPHLLTKTTPGDTHNSICITFFLSNQPSLDAAETLFTVTMSFDAVPHYGEIPEQIRAQLKNLTGSQAVCFCENSYFRLNPSITTSSTPVSYMWDRYDYHGTQLCQFVTKSYPGNIVELEEGGFLVENATDNNTCLSAYDISGNLIWQETIGDDLYISDIFQRNGNLYLFGEIDSEDAPSDIVLFCIDSNGEMLSQTQLRGSDFDSISHVEETEKGFYLIGSTQSKDGDLPFSKDGGPVTFTAQVSADLSVHNISTDAKIDAIYRDIVGYHKGQIIYSDDPICTADNDDYLPENCHVSGIFDCDDGYVIVREHTMGVYPFQNPLVSYIAHYRRTIVTGYDSQGAPLWQNTSAIYVK